MFSGNGRISVRQLYRNHAVACISLSALLPPLLMNQKSTGSILLGLAFWGLFLAVTVFTPRPEAWPVKILCYAHYWILGTMLVRLSGLLVQRFLLTDTALWIITGWFYLFCYYNVYKGLECRMRVGEVLFPFFLFLLLLLSILMYGEVRPGGLLEIQVFLDNDNVYGGYRLFCWLGAIQGLWHLRGQIAGEKGYGKAVFKIWITGGLFTLAWSLFTYCIYGNAGHTRLLFPLASAMTLAHFPGNVIGRLDALFVFAWVIGLFLLCSGLFAPLMDQEPDKKHKYLLIVLLAVSFVCGCSPACIEWGQWLLYYVTTPLQILLLLIYGFGKVGGKGKKAAVSCFFLLMPFFLTGCGAQELEQRSLVMAVSVDAGEEDTYLFTFGFGAASGGEKEEEKEEPFQTEAASLSAAKELYWESCQKNMDFNHLKCFYFSEKLLKQHNFSGLLKEIQAGEVYSRGTLAYATQSDASEEAKKEDHPEEGMPIHKILNAWYNQKPCKIPMVTGAGTYKGEISWPY